MRGRALRGHCRSLAVGAPPYFIHLPQILACVGDGDSAGQGYDRADSGRPRIWASTTPERRPAGTDRALAAALAW